MENAADALKMGAWVLIFVVALSICINAFGQAKECFETILNNADREYLTSYIPPSGNTQRIVGFESIIPSIYRSFKENYKVVFKGYVLYTDKGEDIDSIDLIINGYTDDVKEEFLKRILYGENDPRFSTPDAQAYTASHFSDIKFGNGLYNLIKGKMFKESLGVYDPNETEGGSTSTPEASKKERRVITYEEVV